MDYIALQKQLHKNILGPLYLFLAKDDYIAGAYVNLMRQKIAFGELGSLNETIFEEKKADPAQVAAACLNLPVMAERRIVVVKDKAAAKNAELAAFLAGYAKKPCLSTTLIVYTNEIDKRTALYRAFSDNGIVVEFDKMKNAQLADWLRHAFEKRGMKIREDALSYLLEAGDYTHRESEIDMGYYANEVEKLCNYQKKGKEITLEMVKKASSFNLNEDVFQFTDSLARGDLSGANKQLYRLTYNRVAPQSVIGAAARAMRNICVCQSLFAGGKSEAAIAKECGLHPFAVKKAVEVRSAFDVEDGKKALLVLNNLDVMLKTGLMDNDTAMALMAEDIASKKFTLARELA